MNEKELKRENELRKEIAHLDEVIEEEYRYLKRLHDAKVELKNSLFISRYNRGVRA
jgi:hypothetical protein